MLSYTISDLRDKIIERIRLRLSPVLQPVLLVGTLDEDSAIKRKQAIEAPILDDIKDILDGIVLLVDEAVGTLWDLLQNPSNYLKKDGIAQYGAAGNGVFNINVAIQTNDDYVGWRWLHLMCVAPGGVPKKIDVPVRLFRSSNGSSYTDLGAWAAGDTPAGISYNNMVGYRYAKATFYALGNGDVAYIIGQKIKMLA